MAIPPIRAILLVGYNILRTTCRKYGLYLCISAAMLFLHSYSGRYNYSSNGGSNTGTESTSLHLDAFAAQKQHGDKTLEIELAVLESKIHEKDGKISVDSHNKGPPGLQETAAEESPPQQQQQQDVSASCSELNKEASSAADRASSLHCKQLIANISCQIESGTLYPDRLVSYCPSNGQGRGRYLGCYSDRRHDRLLRGHVSQQKQNTPLICTDHCYTRGYVHAGLQYGRECFCGNEDVASQHLTSDTACDMSCPGDLRYSCGGYLALSLYQTGLAKHVSPPVLTNATGHSNVNVSIAYILTLNGRATRQMFRLFRALYHTHHCFYIHVDKRSSHMHRAALRLAEGYSNVFVTRQRHATIWGGSTLLTVLLQAMEELINKPHCHWDFVVNLSESDYPIKSNQALEEFLWRNKGRNFLKSHGQDTNRFLKKQGLDRTFLQCEEHMWRLGERKLPSGVRIDGGSDWVCLSNAFVRYVISSNDQLISGLRKVYEYTLLPAESFFHTVLRNSAFCPSFTDNNLHLTNWKRKLGCRCQYKNIVDWCGCSPNDFTPKDWNKLYATRSRNLFFGRKFEAVVSLAVINKLDAWLYHPYRDDTPSLHSYWENRYHHLDTPSPSRDAHKTLYLSAARLAAQFITTTVNSASANNNLHNKDVDNKRIAGSDNDNLHDDNNEDAGPGRDLNNRLPNVNDLRTYGDLRNVDASKAQNEDGMKENNNGAKQNIYNEEVRLPHDGLAGDREKRSVGEEHEVEPALKRTGTLNNVNCVVTVNAVLQAHSYNSHDVYKGVVVEAAAVVKDASVFTLEGWLAPHPASAASILTTHLLQDIKIGTEFDLKEQMFRNLEGALGPTHNNITVALHYTGELMSKSGKQGRSGDGSNKGGTSNDNPKHRSKSKAGNSNKGDGGTEEEEDAVDLGALVVVLVDPLRIVAEAMDINIDTVDAHQLVTFSTLQQPLRPGLWRVYVVKDGSLAGSRTFPVLPLAYQMARDISVTEARTLHSGPEGKYYTKMTAASVLPSLYVDAIPLPGLIVPGTSSNHDGDGAAANEDQVLRRWTERHSRLYGENLHSWIDDIVLSSWSLWSSCYVEGSDVPTCVRQHVQPCTKAPWSTRYPDPKSDLTHPDPSTGRLMDAYRVQAALDNTL
uniref:protein xylosyltransferase n=2 Tax=Hirondellea gigas TaxID=1518452 RepID=A0A6A7G8G9_9CRUS